MSENDTITFESLVRDILLIDNVMISVKSENAIAEVKIGKNLPFRVREQWANIGDESGPWHIHVNIQETYEARFVIEDKLNGRNSYSIRFLNSTGGMILRVNFVKMYNDNNELNQENLLNFENLFSKHGRKNSLYFNK